MNNSTLDNMTLSEGGQARSKSIPTLLLVFTALQQIVFLISCVGNALVIIMFVRYIKPITATTKFILCLSVADFFVGISAGTQIFYIFYRDWSKNLYTCLIRYQVVFMMTVASEFSVAFTTFDRYIAICHNAHHHAIMRPAVVNSLIIFTWIFPLVMSCLPFWGFNQWNTYHRCSFAFVLEDWIYLALAVVEYSLMAFCVVLYGLILKKAWSVYNRSLEKVTSIPDNERSRKIVKNIRSAKVMGYVTLAMIVCWSPYKVYQFRYGVGEKSDLTDFNLSSWLVFLGMFSSIINPFIYAYQRKDFRQSCKEFLGCHSRDNLSESAPRSNSS